MPNRPTRIFQIAKELNISHTEILMFLRGKGVKIASHMAPVDDSTYHLILSEFAKEKATVDRLRKDQVRREIHDTRIKERQNAKKKTILLSLDDQRKLEKQELENAKQEAIDKKRRAVEDQKAQEEKVKADAIRKVENEKVLKEQKAKQAAEEKDSEEKKKKEEAAIPKKRKLRKIELRTSDSKKAYGFGKANKPKDDVGSQKAKDRVKQVFSKPDTKKKKRDYRRSRVEKETHQVTGEKQTIKISEFVKVDELSKLLDVSVSDIIKTCFGLGIMATINQRLEWDVIELIADEFNYSIEKEEVESDQLLSLEQTDADKEKAEPRAAVVTVMGHVDHGKTSILDYIRDANVVAGESGGITQHIGAYKVEMKDGKNITFIDTPGHEAFTAMRARGAQVTDIVVLVVAADDAVMPQTIEAIDHAKAAGAPLIIAINKTDKPGGDTERVKRQLADHNVLVEDWGGKVQSIPTSAKTGDGINILMDAILLEAEMLELKANRTCNAKGTVIDSRLDRGLGPIATILIQKGTLSIGDPFICNNYSGKVRAMMNERDVRIKKAYPSDAVQILGFEKVPQAGDVFAVMEDERELKRIAANRQRRSREIDHKKLVSYTLDSMSALIKEGTMQQLPLIIKGDVDGSIEAVSESLLKLNTGEVGVNIIHKAVGMVSESDVLLAEASKAVIIGFNVQVGSNAKLQSKRTGVEIRSYSIIYKAVEEITLALEGMLKPDTKEEVSGRALVQMQFKIPKIGNIAGAKVDFGVITRNDKARLIRDDEILIENTSIISLKRFKDDAKEVKEGLECGIGLEGIKKYIEGDIIETFSIIEVKRKLEKS